MLDALSRRNRALLLAGAAVLAFGAAVFNAFVDWDDIALILENPIVQGPFFAGVKGAFTTFDPELYIPLTLLSFQFEHLIHSNAPSLTHALNILLHAGNVLLVWRIAAILLKDERTAFLVALLFGVHPIQTEAVAWATGRKDLLSSVFGLGALLLYLRGRTAGSFVLFTLGLLAKVTIAPLALLLPVIDRRMHGKISWPRFALMLLPAIVFMIIAMAGKAEAIGKGGILEMLLLAPYGMVFLLGKILVPLHLAVQYPFTDPVTIADPRIWGGFVAVAGIGFAAWKASKKYPVVGFGGIFVLLTLLPAFANVRRGDHFLDVFLIADRSAYLTLIGFLLMLTPLMTLRPKIAERLVAALAVVFIGLSILQTRRWRDTDTLFIWTAYVSPYSHVAQMNVGNIANREGRFGEAIDRYVAALSIRETPLALYNIGKAFASTGQTDDALAAYARALELDPTLLDAKLSIGTALFNEGRTEEALAAFRELAAKHPEFVPGVFNGAVILAQAGKDAEAIVILENLAVKHPEFTQGQRALAELYARNGRQEEADILRARLEAGAR